MTTIGMAAILKFPIMIGTLGLQRLAQNIMVKIIVNAWHC